MVHRDVHPNWDMLMQFCEKSVHGKMQVTFADGIPVFVEAVQVQMRFGPIRGRHKTGIPLDAPLPANGIIEPT